MNKPTNDENALLREQGVGGSNPLAPTSHSNGLAKPVLPNSPDTSPETPLLAVAVGLINIASMAIEKRRLERLRDDAIARRATFIEQTSLDRAVAAVEDNLRNAIDRKFPA